MRRRTTLAGSLATVAVLLATAAAAAPPRSIPLRIGDAVDVVGTRVACFAITSNHKDGVGCVLMRAGKPIVGSYGAGLAVDGTAALTRIKADGTAESIFKRRLQSASAAGGKVYEARVGDLFGLRIDARLSLGCKVIKVTDRSLAPIYRGVKVSCWRATATAPLPRSYGVSISDKFAGVFAFDARGNIEKDALLRRQPR